MPRMIRKQVYLADYHDRMLKRRAKGGGVTEAEIIREALDGIATFAGHSGKVVFPDPAAGRKALAFMHALARRRSKGPSGRGWTRDDLYEDRIGRWPRS